MNKSSAAYYNYSQAETVFQGIEDETPFAGEINVDESYFGAKIKGVGRRGLLARYLDMSPIDSFMTAAATPLIALGGMGRR